MVASIQTVAYALTCVVLLAMQVLSSVLTSIENVNGSGTTYPPKDQGVAAITTAFLVVYTVITAYECRPSTWSGERRRRDQLREFAASAIFWSAIAAKVVQPVVIFTPDRSAALQAWLAIQAMLYFLFFTVCPMALNNVVVKPPATKDSNYAPVMLLLGTLFAWNVFLLASFAVSLYLPAAKEQQTAAELAFDAFVVTLAISNIRFSLAKLRNIECDYFRPLPRYSVSEPELLLQASNSSLHSSIGNVDV